MKNRHYYRIDMIRIIACLAVFFYHLGLLKGGYLAVCSFFVLTGYLSVIGGLYKKNINLFKYYKGIILKVYLPLIIVVFCSIGIISLLPDVFITNIKPEVASILGGYNNIWQLHVNFDYFAKRAVSPFTHLWYMSLYMQFSLIFPLIFILFQKIGDKIHKSIPCILLGLLGIGSFVLFYKGVLDGNLMNSYYSIQTRAFALLFGMLLGFSHHYFKPFITKTNNFKFLCYLICLVLMFIFIDASSPLMSVAMLITCFLTMRLIDHSLVKEKHINELDEIVVSSAAITYEMYLIQFPVIFCIGFLNVEYTYKILLSVIITVFLSHILDFIFDKHKKGLIKVFFTLILVGFSIFGLVRFITSKDYTAEINEMKAKIEENTRIIEEKNKEYEENIAKEQEVINEITENDKYDDEKIKEIVKNLPVTGIGDSVLLMGAPQLYKQFPKGYFDGKVSRSIISSKSLVSEMKSSNKISKTVILGLATNGTFSTKRVKEFIEMFGDREIFWINSHNGDDPTFNQKFEEFAKDYPNIHIVDWDKAANEHPDWIYKDGVHPKERTGAKLYAQIIFDKVFEVYKEKYKKQQEEDINKKQEEQRNKITFYGDIALTSAFDEINEKFKDYTFKTTPVETYEELYNELKTQKENNTLDQRVILLFDKIYLLSQEQYNSIVELLDGHEIIICNITDNTYTFTNTNVKVLDFYNEDYLMPDKVLLTDEGKKVMVNALYDLINNKH